MDDPYGRIAAPPPPLGTNQSGMRARNERLILTLVRQQGEMAKSDLAKVTGLSAQTVSVIMRALETDGLLLRGEPVRGRIGQPSIPMRLNPDGAFFLGLKLGRRSADLVLLDFLGQVRAAERLTYSWPTVAGVLDFVGQGHRRLVQSMAQGDRARVQGLGIAMPYRMWDWVGQIGAPEAAMQEWRAAGDLRARIEVLTGLPVTVQNDATSACGAELIFGTGERPRNFLYFYFGTFIGGGLVIGGQLFQGTTGNAGSVGSMPIPLARGGMGSLIGAASLQTLADRMAAAGESADHIWQQAAEWRVSAPVLDAWATRAAEAIAWATLSATALLELDAVLIEGWMPAAVRADMVARVLRALDAMDGAGLVLPQVREGTVGPEARALGAAAVPLSQRYLVEGDLSAGTP